MRWLAIVALGTLAIWPAHGQDLNTRNETAIKAAVQTVAPSVVKIETAGGTETVGQGREAVRKGIGPTTGLVVAADGFIISSSFNFANKPSSIFVTIPGQSRIPAKIVANDLTRMLTLLKVDKANLPVPVAYPKKDLAIGQWSMAVGRTLSSDDNAVPSISVGIVSALGRMWGKAIQTDTKVSPVNYGGPLIAIDGRVMGVLIPASSRGEGETAGVEWYDSGIGFAVPLEEINAILPRLKLRKDLRKGLLGITQKGDEPYTAPAVIGTVSSDSVAKKVGIRPGDTIIRLAEKPVANFSQLQHILGPKYEGDTINVVVRRGDKELTFNDVQLTGAVSAFVTPFLGLLPMRDDPELGLEVRYIYPNSPAAQAGIAVGDRIMALAPPKVADQPEPKFVPFTGRVGLTALLATVPPGETIRLKLKKKGKTEDTVVSVKVAAATEELPGELPSESTKGRALEPLKTAVPPKQPMPMPMPNPAEVPPADKEKEKEKEKTAPETGLLKRQNAALGREYWAYVPRTYTPNIAHGVIVWLHPQGQGGKDAEKMLDIWRLFCEE
ncbi:MAG: PDZ domain-containing protein, partial [Gemmataceae bacterium]